MPFDTRSPRRPERRDGAPTASREYPVEIPVAGGRIPAVLHLPESPTGSLVICCHGLLSSKDSTKFVAGARAMAQAGLGALRFDFTGCGDTACDAGLTLVETRMIDLRAVLDAALQVHSPTAPLGSHFPEGPPVLALWGSSFGGYVALLAAAEYRETVRASACWATPFGIGSLARTMESSEILRKRLSPIRELGQPTDLSAVVPSRRVLVIHGQQDEMVPWPQAVSIYRRMGEPRRLLLLEAADHRVTDPSWRSLAMQATIDWLGSHL